MRVRFFDFSTAFNTIRPALLSNKLLDMQMNAPLVAWFNNYLTGRPKYVQLQNIMSDTIVSTTGAPQGTVLSPFLFTLYTSDFRFCSLSCHLQKFSDDCHCWMYQQGSGGQVQDCCGQVCGVVWTKPPSTQHRKDKGVGGGL